MKKALALCAALLAVTIAGCRTTMKPVIQDGDEYFQGATVTRMSAPDTDGARIVTVTAENGHEYEFIGYEFETGEHVKLFMGDNATSDPTDDVVYDAWID